MCIEDSPISVARCVGQESHASLYECQSLTSRPYTNEARRTRMNNMEEKNKRTGLLVWMIVSQALTLVSLLIWLLVAGLSVMAFDSGETTQAWTLVIAVWSYPIFPILMVIAAWIAYARRKNTSAAILSGLSFAPPFLLYIGIFVVNMFWFATH